MKIDVSELLKKVGNVCDVETEEKVSYPDDGLNIIDPVKVKLHLINTGVVVLVIGFVKARVELECSRCLNRFVIKVKAEIKEQYSKRPPGIKYNFMNEAEIKDADIVFPIDSSNKIDLDEAIRQNLLMSLPIKVLCKPNCPRLDSDSKMKIDPRLEKLKELLKK